MSLQTTAYVQGTRVRVTQQMPRGDGAWATTVTGTIVAYRQARTGSWFAHARENHLWLDRLELELEDGERTVLNLDRYTRVECEDA